MRSSDALCWKPRIFSLLPEQAKTDRINTTISTKSVFIFSFCFLITSDFSMNKGYVFNVMLGNGWWCWVVSSCSVYLKLLPCHFICLQPVFCLHPRVRHSTFVPSHTGNTFEEFYGSPPPKNWKIFYFLSHRQYIWIIIIKLYYVYQLYETLKSWKIRK